MLNGSAAVPPFNSTSSLLPYANVSASVTHHPNTTSDHQGAASADKSYIGIIVGVVVGIILVAAIIIIVIIRRRRLQKDAALSTQSGGVYVATTEPVVEDEAKVTLFNGNKGKKQNKQEQQHEEPVETADQSSPSKGSTADKRRPNYKKEAAGEAEASPLKDHAEEQATDNGGVADSSSVGLVTGSNMA